jgi:beta-glucanase (GH16 family)
MRGQRAIVAVVLILATMPGCKEEEEKAIEYGLIWQDEFDGPAGELPNTERWQFDIGTDWGNAQLEQTTNRPTNVSLDGEGNLAITAREEEFAGQDYTSGRIKTKDLFERAWGRFEARIKVPVGQGIWPAFWMLGADIDDVNWPNCGEIDIMEYRGQEPRVLFGSIHGPGHAGDNAVNSRHELAQGGFHLGFHIFSIDWSAERIVWQVDGFTYHTVKPADLPPGASWVYNHPFFLLLNVAVGGRWVGDPDENTLFPQTMLVDYVRVYGALP